MYRHRHLSAEAEHQVCSFSETSALKLGHALADEVASHTRRFLAHVSPNASRVDSSNYNPLDLWACGFQMGMCLYELYETEWLRQC